MPTFATPRPVSLRLDLVAGTATVVASDRTDTVVEVRPADDSGASLKAAEETTVEHHGDSLVVRTPRPKRFKWFGPHGSVDVRVSLPAGSHVAGNAAAASLRCEGPLGHCRFRTASGDVVVDRAEGDVSIATATGRLHIGSVAGSASVKSADGDTWIGHVGGSVVLHAANGSLVVDRAERDVVAKTANGDVRIGAIGEGSVVLTTACGDLEVGIPEGTAAWLDVHSHSGAVRSELGATDQPGAGDRTVRIKARAYSGDVVIRRAS